MNYNQSSQKKNGEVLVKEYVDTKDPKKKEEAIKSYLALVKYIIGRINIPKSEVLDREDLYQYGIIGLLDALERYDPDRGIKFKTFAYKRIHGEILDAIRKNGAFSRTQTRRIKKIQEAKQRLSKKLERQPTKAEIIEETGLDDDKYEKSLQLMKMTFHLSLDGKVNSGDGGNNSLKREEVIADKKKDSPEEAHSKDALKKQLKNHIKDLPERKRIILALYYYEELTLADIGRVIGLSESRVSQIMKKTIAELRKKIKN